MKFEKKVLTAVLALTLTLCAVGCGKKETTDNTDAGVTSEDAASPEDADGGDYIPLPAGNSSEDTAVEADVFVEKIDNLSEDFITGADLSSIAAEFDSGVKYYDFDGNELDEQGFFDFLYNDCGVNYVRIRVWVNPYDENGNSYGGGNNDIETAKKIGTWATKAGMRVLIDFHYSDFWADPSKQRAPKEWEDLSVDEKAVALRMYTEDSLNALIDAGVDVGMVQIGNETTTGFCGEKEWEDMCTLFKAGSEAVRGIDKDILIAIHFTNPEKGSYPAYASYLEQYGVDYDVFASSYYPYWHGEVGNMKAILNTIVNKYDKKVMIVETSYIHTYEDGDGSGNTESEGKAGDAFYYDVSEQGQCDAIREAANAVAFCGDAGLGIFYWEPAWIPVGVYADAENPDEVYENNKKIWEEKGSGWAASYASDYDEDAAEYYGGSAVDNEALFDFYGHPLASAKIYKYIRTGAVADLAVADVTADNIEINVDEYIALPEVAHIRYNDGTVNDMPVSWIEESLAGADASTPGEYVVDGTVDVDGKSYDVSVTVKVLAENLLANPGFEDENMSMWNIDSDIISRKDDSSNVHDGAYCLHFWSEKDIEYTVYQTVTLDAGEYVLGTYIEGGDCGDDASFVLYAEYGNESLEQKTGVTKWQEWDNPEIDNIVITEDGTELTIGVKVKAQAKGWGAWDDFYLYAK